MLLDLGLYVIEPAIQHVSSLDEPGDFSSNEILVGCGIDPFGKHTKANDRQ